MSEFNKLSFNVLCYREDGDWVALALDFDLIGHGDTPDQAVEVLCGAVTAQIEHALDLGDPGILNFPAEQKYFDMYDEARKTAFLTKYFRCKGRDDREQAFTTVPFNDVTPPNTALNHA
jgi:hypothetical protein